MSYLVKYKTRNKSKNNISRPSLGMCLCVMCDVCVCVRERERVRACGF